MTDEARAGEPRTEAGRRFVDGGSPKWATVARAERAEIVLAIEREAAAVPALDVDRLHPYLRHTATCALQTVRDNWPGDPDCTCGLRAEYVRLSESGGKP